MSSLDQISYSIYRIPYDQLSAWGQEQVRVEAARQGQADQETVELRQAVNDKNDELESLHEALTEKTAREQDLEEQLTELRFLLDEYDPNWEDKL